MRPSLAVLGVLTLLAAGCGFTNSSSKTETVVVTHTVTQSVTTATDAAATTTSSSATAACGASDLSATFRVLEGSAGAGNIVYTLHVTNTSQSNCTIAGIPSSVEMLTADGSKLNTRSTQNGGTNAAVATLHPGDSASAQARFSPDVDPCGDVYATTLRFSPAGGGYLDAKVDPKTRVCGQGVMQWDPFTTAS
jgi:hypothetical protein